MNKVNWKVRFKNKAFWIALIPALLTLAQKILSVFGIAFDFTVLGNQLIEIVNALFLVLAIVGIINDPTTAGLSDSARALKYEEPNKE